MVPAAVGELTKHLLVHVTGIGFYTKDMAGMLMNYLCNMVAGSCCCCVLTMM